jgi:hypothetical protein
MNSRTYLPAALAALTSVLLPTLSWAENEIGYIEKFALAADREKVLGELVPGSEDYYFFHALHYQNTRNDAKLADILDQWRKRFPNEVARRRIIENREALLDYDATPQKTIAYLKERLNVQFNHQQEARDRKPNLPTALDPVRIALEVFKQDSLANDGGLDSLTVNALESLITSKARLTNQQRRAILNKLPRPDIPGLVDFIAEELKLKDSPGFGGFPIHHQLLPEQLDALAKTIPTLTNNETYVHLRLRKLAPSADVETEYDAAEREAWIERAWAYVRNLPAAFNTLKTHVLYQRLDHDRKKGIYDQARFLDYLKLPRRTDYVNLRWLERVTERQPASDLNANLSAPLLGARPIGSDEELVREYFLTLFDRAAAANAGSLGEEMMAPYTEFVRDTWLKPILAEALIVGGHGNAERWASLLTPSAFQRLKERVDIEFPRTNAQFFAPGADVAFDVTLKNTPKLIVKIYELNALNFFLTQKRQLNTDLNLDGLVANSEQTHTYETGPFKRTRQNFKFPDLKSRRGAWIIEFIGGGRSSRALVRVGQWQTVQRTGPSGDLLTALDESGKAVPDAVIWLDGRRYTLDEKLGGIVVPFTAQPGMRPIVLASADGTFATLTRFDHHGEDYKLDAQFHVEREQLLARRSARLAIRPALLLGESHLDPALLKEARLVVTSVTHDKISTTKEFKHLQLSAGSVLTQDIMVPERLATLTVTLAGKVEVLSAGGEKRDVSASHSWQINGMDRTEATNDGHLSKSEGNYVYQLLGKNGEPLADQQIVFAFKHHGFERSQTVALKTDENGRVVLGALAGIKSFHAKTPNNRDSRWQLDTFERTWASVVHTGTNQPIRIPAPLSLAGANAEALKSGVSLLQLNANTFTVDHVDKVKLADGFLVIDALAPGDYSLRLRREDREIEIKVSGAKASHGWYLGTARNLEAKAEAPLQINAIATDKEFITVKLANVTPFTRLHVAATRFEPGRGLFAGLGNFTRFGAAAGSPARLPNLYSAGRAIGDEYRYILDRRYAKAYPGNMLTRPGLLLNPWEVRDTALQELAQQAGQAAGSTRGGRAGSETRAAMAGSIADPQGMPQGAAADTNLDFLAEAAPVLYNLLPEKDGTVKIARAALGDRQHVQVYAEDLVNAVWQSFALPEAATKVSDQRLTRNLDPAKPFAQKKEITVLEPGKSLTLTDILTSEMETYDTLGGIHSLFTTLNADPKLVEFSWILQWPKLKDDEKHAKYSEYASHELSFFLSRKDPEFFDKVIKPYLVNKKDKTFMDEFLLGIELTKYLEPSAYAQLNVVERALLALRLKAAGPNVARQLRELWEMVPPNPDLQDRLFETALRGREMEEALGGMSDGALRFRGVKAQTALMDNPAPAPEAAAAPAPASPAALPGAPKPAARSASAPLKAKNGGRPQLEQLSREAKEGLALGVDTLEELDASKLAELRDAMPELAKKAEDAISRRGLLRQAVDVKAGFTSGGAGGQAADFAYFGAEAAQRGRENYRALYRQLGATKEWAENNYYKLPIVAQNADLVQINAFWRDYAKWVADGSKGSFVSGHVAEASRNFTEMMLALAVLDLPFEAAKHTTKADGGQFTLTAAGPIIAYHKEIKPAALVPAGDPGATQGQLLVSQSFFRHGDRHRQEGNEKIEKYVTAEFLTGAVYGGNVVVTNPTSAPVKAEVLLQIPKGALPVIGSKATDSRRVRLEPYTTQTFEYYFYFPTTAKPAPKFPHFPVNVAVTGPGGKEGPVAAAKPFEFNVVEKLTEVDKASWDYISQYGTEDEVFAFLEKNNLASLNLVRVAWRCRDAAFFRKFTAFLRNHHVWEETIYTYALVHNDPAALREWIKHKDDFVSQCGPWLATTLVILDPIERRGYEHLEYAPLINQRAHRLGSEWRVANPAVREQYQELLQTLAHKSQLDAMDQMSVAYYLFLQDRVEEGLGRFHAVDAKLLPTKVQHDYFRCYAGLYEGNLADARGIAAAYADYPITRWKTLFADVTAQLDEAEGKAVKNPKGDQPDREKEQSELTATEPTFDFKVENRNIALTWSNLGEVTLNYYLMDPEFSFSSNPFVSQDASRFSIIKPNRTAKQELPKGKNALDVALPAEFARANVLVEVVGAGERKTQAYHANTLKLTVTENYGRLETRDSGTDRPLPKAYVKVYAKLKNGTIRFFKDGYTDLRGRFDYATLNSPIPQPVAPGVPPSTVLTASAQAPANGLDYQMLKPAELNEVEKLSILILSDTNGATTREVNPPRD